jgi:hypothetical protein
VLLARRERQHVAAPVARIERLADDAPGHRAHVRIARREESHARPAVRDGQPEALPLGDRDVDAAAARGTELRQRERFRRRAHDERASVVRRSCDRRQILHGAEHVRIPDDDAERGRPQRRRQRGHVRPAVRADR